jgi:L-malate glycosyltransferase
VIANLDVLVQPKRGPEGLGRALLEAMACAVPVVAIDRWGPAEIVRHGETGLLAPDGNVSVLAAHMEALGRDPALRRRLGDGGRAWILAHLDRADLAARFVDLVRSWTEQAPATAHPLPQLRPAIDR